MRNKTYEFLGWIPLLKTGALFDQGPDLQPR